MSSKKKKKVTTRKKDPRRPRDRAPAPATVAEEVAPVETAAPRPGMGLFAPLLARFPSQWFLVFLSVLSGVLWFLACADWDIWPLAWVAMVPGLVAIEAAPTTRRALLYGWLTGIVANVGGFYWITGLLTRFAHLPLPVAILGLFLLSAYQASVFLFFALAIRKLRERTRRRGRAWSLALLAPLVMVAFEMLVPFLFPFYLAITQAWVTPVIQVADLTGPVGVTALLLAVNGGVYDLLVAAKGTGRRRALPLGAAAGALALALVYGFVRMHQVDAARAEAPAIQVGVVQGNIPFDEKGSKRRDLAPGQLRDLQAVSADLEKQGADLIVWSESSYPYSVPRDQETDFPEGVRTRGGAPLRVRRGFEKPLVFGAITEPPDEEDLNYNSALYLDSDDRFAGRFDKIFLLMFGEYIPFRETLEPVLPRNASHFARGEGVVTFPFSHEGRSYRLGPMICYEDILPGFGRKLAALHPHLLVNITNDAWFGDTAEPWEHLALSVFRAVESRIDLVRSVNTGVSAYVDANGRVMSRSYAVDPHENRVPMTGHLDSVVLMEGGHTFYARVGDLFGWLCAIATVLLWIGWPLLDRLRARRARI